LVFTRPFLFGKLRAGDASEQIGAALGLAEVFVRMDKAWIENTLVDWLRTWDFYYLPY
jgi:hypothetical protein